MLAPERLIVPDEQAVEILQLVDGKASVAAIVDELAARYNAPREMIAKRRHRHAAGLRRQGMPADDPYRPPLALLAELTHRCPLQCPYCSNPVELERAASELTKRNGAACSHEAAALGVLQVHFSGGEPMARRDLAALIAAASRPGSTATSSPPARWAASARSRPSPMPG